ncbi:MAG: hypothetical protein IPK64_22180 [bacterium]|nr:hypothetical protein [bacterium]
MAETLERLLAWAREGRAPAPADPLDRPLTVESRACQNRLSALLEPPPAAARRVGRPLAVPPRLLPPP